MKFKWEKRGILISDAPIKTWAKDYYQFPAVLELTDRIRIFYTTRPAIGKDGNYVTYIRYVDLQKNDFKIIEFSEKPVIDLGGIGEFDEFGTMPGDFIEFNDSIYMYYTGWQRMKSVPYTFSIGLAISNDGGNSFKKTSKGPLVSISAENPFSVGSGAAITEDGIHHLFYIAGTDWFEIKNKLEHSYAIKHATSNDGINWDVSHGMVIEQKNKFEAIAAPTIIKINNSYHMWYSYRDSFNFRDGQGSYKIGYAHSKDLFKWIRDDNNSGISLSEEGWDSKMICYPFVIKIKEKIYMFYNGNTFGKFALGYAILDI